MVGQLKIFKEIENIWQEFFDFYSNPERRTSRCKSDTLPRDHLPDYKTIVNIQLKYVMLNTVMHSTDGVFFFGLPVFINGYGVPFLSYYMLVLLIDLHKQLLFAAG